MVRSTYGCKQQQKKRTADVGRRGGDEGETERIMKIAMKEERKIACAGGRDSDVGDGAQLIDVGEDQKGAARLRQPKPCTTMYVVIG